MDWYGKASRNVEMGGVGNTERDSSQQELVAVLLKAASTGDIVLMESLLQQPETLRQVNATDESNGGALMTPLHWASKNGHANVRAIQAERSSLRDQLVGQQSTLRSGMGMIQWYRS